MTDEDFVTLSNKFETLTRELKESQDTMTRKRVLGQLRVVIQRLDALILNEHPDLFKE